MKSMVAFLTVFVLLFATSWSQSESKDPEEKDKAPPSVALVLDLAGEVTVHSAAGHKEKATRGDLLYAGDKLTTGENGKAVVGFVSDFHKEILKPGKTVKITASGCEPPENIAEKGKALPRISDSPSFDKLGWKGGKIAAGLLRSQNKSLPKIIPRVTPICGAALVTARPSFRWNPDPSAKGYAFEVAPEPLVTGTKKWEAMTTETTMDYTEKEPLGTGQYRWKVHAIAADGEKKQIVNSIFRIPNKGELAMYKQLESMTGESADDADLLFVAGIYQHYEVFHEALKLIERLSKKNPKEPLLYAIRAGYYEEAGRPKDAENMRQRAKDLGYKLPEASK